MSASPMICNLCGEEITRSYWAYDDGTVVCSWCERHRKKCEMCGKPVSKYYYVLDNHVLCIHCYKKSDTCDSCGKLLIGKYTVFDDRYKICGSCHEKRTSYNITLTEARMLVHYQDIEIGRKMLMRTSSYLCIMAFSTTINRLSSLLTLRSRCKLNYVSDSYYFCSREIRYLRNAIISPVEAIAKGVGNCGVKSALLASLLKCYGLRVSVCTTENHVFVIAFYPSAPKEYRMFQQKRRRDGTSWGDWIGMDPASNCIFGRLPRQDFTQIYEHPV